MQTSEQQCRQASALLGETGLMKKMMWRTFADGSENVTPNSGEDDEDFDVKMRKTAMTTKVGQMLAHRQLGTAKNRRSRTT